VKKGAGRSIYEPKHITLKLLSFRAAFYVHKNRSSGRSTQNISHSIPTRQTNFFLKCQSKALEEQLLRASRALQIDSIEFNHLSLIILPISVCGIQLFNDAARIGASKFSICCCCRPTPKKIIDRWGWRGIKAFIYRLQSELHALCINLLYLREKLMLD